MIEIERKFLVEGEFKSHAKAALRIRQGYLSTDAGATVRVRTKGDKGYLTIKGKTGESGMSRFEWEKEIPSDEAERLLGLCKAVIDKTRYLVDVGNHVFEVDEFYGDNQGLLIAEVELSSEDEAFDRPQWLGKEVTGDVKYYNSRLLSCPYCRWKHDNIK